MGEASTLPAAQNQSLISVSCRVVEWKQKFGRGTRTKLENLNCCVNTPLHLSHSHLVLEQVLSTHLIQGETEGKPACVAPSRVQGKLWERKASDSLNVTFLCPPPARIVFLPVLVVTPHD